jgi:pseudouridine synthase
MCGVASRRGAEKLIKEGRVTLNDNLVERLGTVFDEEKDFIKVDGKIAKPVVEKIYILLNKPRNVLTALSDPFHRKTVAHLTKELPVRIYPVGRLDYDTEGVLILTNDGELAYRLAHPKYQIKRVYHALVQGTFTLTDAVTIGKGIELADGHIGKGITKPLNSGIKSSKVEIILTEGHKREVKQLFEAVGHPVKELRRVEFAGLNVDRLKRGRWRYINNSEIKQLRKLIDLS